MSTMERKFHYLKERRGRRCVTYRMTKERWWRDEWQGHEKSLRGREIRHPTKGQGRPGWSLLLTWQATWPVSTFYRQRENLRGRSIWSNWSKSARYRTGTFYYVHSTWPGQPHWLSTPFTWLNSLYSMNLSLFFQTNRFQKVCLYFHPLSFIWRTCTSDLFRVIAFYKQTIKTPDRFPYQKNSQFNFFKLFYVAHWKFNI